MRAHLVTPLYAVVALATAACVHVDPPPRVDHATTTTTQAGSPPSDAACGEQEVTASIRPTGVAWPDNHDPYIAEIVDRGTLRVGVDASTKGFSSYNPASGQIEGFDVDMAEEVALALLGDRSKVDLVVVPNDQRDDSLVEGRVDLVAQTYSITCERWRTVAFSTEYFTTHQRLLVSRSSPIDSIDDLDEDVAVCGAVTSTSLDHIADKAPRAQRRPAPSNASCLVFLQQGLVDVASTDETILQGFVDQDPSLHIVGDDIADEPYGLGLPPDQPEWVQYVNSVIEDVRRSGRWEEIYAANLSGPVPEPPEAKYGR